jgi:hypothetical protein
MSATHEDFAREVRRSGPSDRNFGLVIGAAFLLIGLAPLRHAKPVRLWSLALSATILLLAWIRPTLLNRANRMWMALGRFLGKVVNPVVTALLFYLVFTPAAMVLRWLGKDPLRLRMDRGAPTYWIERGGRASAENMANQF